MSNKIEGIPNGWELVRIGKPAIGEWYIDVTGSTYKALETTPTVLNWYVPVIRKLEKPKQYRPFANAAEFEPHRDRWVIYTSPVDGREAFYKISAFDSERVWLGPDNCGRSHREAFDCLRFESGQPFGVEVTE